MPHPVFLQHFLMDVLPSEENLPQHPACQEPHSPSGLSLDVISLEIFSSVKTVFP